MQFSIANHFLQIVVEDQFICTLLLRVTERIFHFVVDHYLHFVVADPFVCKLLLGICFIAILRCGSLFLQNVDEDHFFLQIVVQDDLQLLVWDDFLTN